MYEKEDTLWAIALFDGKVIGFSAFMPLHQIISQMLSFTGGLTDEEEGVESMIYECPI